MLRLERVSKYYFAENTVVQALRRISLDFKIGEFVAITGVSGSGKSTLLNILSGLDTYEEGKVFFNNQDISNYTLKELEHYRKDYIGYIFQDFNIINSYTVYKNVELALIVQGYNKTELKQKTIELIDKVGLTNVAYQKASKLSGGEKQRTIIARALAKDYQVLICDEPTGNLNSEAAEEIFKLLQENSKDKLVIVVSHDISLLQNYATRKVRLYDGEIMEDAPLKPPLENKTQQIQPKLTNTSILGSFKIGLNNILSVPKKSIFSIFTLIFVLAMIFFSYSAGLTEINKPINVVNPEFPNTTPTRIVLTKSDRSPFTELEMNQIKELKYVRDVFSRDIVFDTVLVGKSNILLADNPYVYFKPLPALALDQYDLIEGRFPINESEVIIGDNGLFQIGEEISVANQHLILPETIEFLNQFSFTVVGIVDEPNQLPDKLHYFYLSPAGLDLVSTSSVYENSEIELQISGTKIYDTPTATWITPAMDESVNIDIRTYGLSYATWIRIDDALEDNDMLVFSMMFYNICREFGYKKEIRDDLDAGLCDAQSFIDSHVIKYRAVTEYNSDDLLFNDINLITYYSLENLLSSSYPLSIFEPFDENTTILYMNQTTFNSYFGENNFQITVIVKDYFDGMKVVDQLKKLDYDYFYPAEMLSENQRQTSVVQNLVTSLIVGVIIFAVTFIGYFITRNLIFSKLKDYLIIRSIGTSKKNIKWIIRFELLTLTIITIAILFLAIFIMNNYLVIIPKTLRLFMWTDYLFLVLIIVVFIQLMSMRFTKLIFNASVSSALKGVER